MQRKGWLLGLGVLGALAVACGVEPGEEWESEEDPLVAAAGSDAPIAVPREGTVLLELSQPSLVSAIEAKGFRFEQHFGVADASGNDALQAKAPLYRFIVDDLGGDLDAKQAKDPKLSTQVSNKVTRILDKGWLSASYARFELTGVLNRLDRLSMGGASDTCGEVRFLYRLAYSKPKTAGAVSYSRLPVVANVVYDVPRGRSESLADCQAVAKEWLMPSGMSGGAAYVSYLTDTVFPLARLRLKQIEINAQVLRTPSESKTDMGGQAEYAFRIYTTEGGRPAFVPLENTPDVDRIRKDPALKTELARWIGEHAAEIDRGTAIMPTKFSAAKVSAFSTFGSARLANKPFTRLFYDAATKSAPDLGTVDLASAKYLGNTAGLLARLDDMSCSGCHQGGRSVAGFHFLGEDHLSRSHVLNVARVGRSPHLTEDLIRRKAFVEALARGESPPAFRGVSFATATPDRQAPRGAPCLLPEGAAALKRTAGCADGLVCMGMTKNPNVALDLGQCLPALKGSGDRATFTTEFAGLPCLSGTVDDAADPLDDTLATKQIACRTPSGGQGYTCRPPSIGVPGGLCYRQCGDGNVARDAKHELCAYAGGKEFDECAGQNDFSSCLTGAIKSGLREACDEDEPCREDYICQRFIKARPTPPEAPRDGRGYCVPTYFLFQVRADGHPNPTPH